METWLRCKLNPGMFTGEVGVEGEQFDGSQFSLFAPAESVETEGPVGGGLTSGWIRVEALDRRGDLVLVRLPRPTFQNGACITVRDGQLSPRRARQPA